MNRPEPLALYLHIPFCTTKCTYCAFNTYIKLEALVPAFVDALMTELHLLADSTPTRLPVHTVFFGGGTPTLLTPDQLGCILDVVRARFDLAATAEITTEANPNDLDEAYLRALRAVGFNRISLGMQTTNPDELRLYARRHDYDTVLRVVPQARHAGFDNLNLDLMYGAPRQTLATWETTLNATIALRPEHISLYALGLEDGTPLKDWVEQGSVPTPDDDLAADMYELATALLGAAGYTQYEISNWALPGRECQHNLQYWRNLPYAGVGPGAHGYAGGVRYATLLAPARYIHAVQTAALQDTRYTFPHTPATVDAVTVDREAEIAETLMMGLRLTHEGIVRATFAARFGVDFVDLHEATLRKYEGYGLLTIDDTRVCLTERGRLLSNMIFRELV
ncbi:MAG: radical SAM family heme chaperone HemW [Armatimonadetes bacterium]|nr:radical SAM family heme chaperone HemW [Anaerolineae bacterium]